MTPRKELVVSPSNRAEIGRPRIRSSTRRGLKPQAMKPLYRVTKVVGDIVFVDFSRRIAPLA